MSLFSLIKSLESHVSPVFSRQMMDLYFRFVLKRQKDFSALQGRRITADQISAVLQRRKNGDSSPRMLLTDQDDLIRAFAHRLETRDCRRPLTDFEPESQQSFIYACENADVGLPYIRRIIQSRAKFYPVSAGSFAPARYLEEDVVAKQVLLELYLLQVNEGFSKYSYGPGADFMNLCQMIYRTKHVPGAFVEIGCYRGSSGQVAVKYMRDKQIFRQSVFVDIFEGFTYDAAKFSSDAIWAGTHATEGVEIVRRRLERFSDPARGLTVDVRRANIISDDCLQDVKEIAVCNIDVDLYEAVRSSLEKVFPKVVPGGVMIVEDAGHHPSLIGARLALDEFLESVPAQATSVVQLESGQFIVFKL